MSIVVKSRCSICNPNNLRLNHWDMCDKCNAEKMENLMHKTVRDVKARPVKEEGNIYGNKVDVGEIQSSKVKDMTDAFTKAVAKTKDEPVNLYKREILPGVWIDFYDIAACYEMTDHAMAHALKKMLAMGNRGFKDEAQDRKDIYDSVVRSNERFELFNNIGKEDGK